MYVSEGDTPVISLLSCHTISRLQNSRFFFLKISKEIGKAWRKSLTRAKREPQTPVGRLASLPSLTLGFQPRSRPFVWLLTLTWIRKNTDRFAVYTIRVNKKEESFCSRSSRFRRSPLTPALDFVAKKKNARDCSKSFDKLSYLPPQKRLLSPCRVDVSSTSSSPERIDGLWVVYGSYIRYIEWWSNDNYCRFSCYHVLCSHQ